MKKYLRIMVIIFIFALIPFVIFKKLKNNAIKEIEKDNFSLNEKWDDLKIKIKNKNIFFYNIYVLENDTSRIIGALIYNSNSMIDSLNRNHLDLVESEFLLNKEILKRDIKKEYIEQIEKIYSDLNFSVEEYNFMVVNYNRKYKIFPQRYFFYKLGYKYGEFFYMKYGSENINPKKKKEDIMNSFGI